MSHHSPIRAELRQWILDTSRAGHDVETLLRLMREHGYDARASRRIVAEVLKLPAGALSFTNVPTGKRPRHPQAPEMRLSDDRRIQVTFSVEAPLVRGLEGLLDAEECTQLIAAARPRLRRALTVSPDGRSQADQARTSEGMFFALGETPLIERIERRIADLLAMPVDHGEGLQILRYSPNQEYQPHNDWFDPAQPGYAAITADGGQRVASLVIYLNTPELGGGTAFPAIGLTVSAQRAAAVYFAYEEGDQQSLHAGLPVIQGEKWIATKWLRERPYRSPRRN